MTTSKRTHFMDAQRALYGPMNADINRGQRSRFARENRKAAATHHAFARIRNIKARGVTS